MSGFQLTIIVLIVLPSAVIVSHYFLTEVVINYFKSISIVDTVSENLEYATLAVNLFSTFQIVVFVVMVLIYPTYPAPFSIEKYFVKRAKGCLSIAKNSNDEVEKMEYVIKGLNSYNSFLKRHIKLEINEIKKIYSKITTLPSKEKSDTLNRIIKSFESGDTLEPVRYLSSLHDNKTKPFLTEEPLEQKIKLQVTYAAGIIPVISTVIQSVINFSGS